MCNCNRGGVEGCSNRGQKNTFFGENSCFGLQSYTDTAQEEWCGVGEDWEKENRKEEYDRKCIFIQNILHWYFNDNPNAQTNVEQVIQHQHHTKPRCNKDGLSVAQHTGHRS